VGLPRAAARDQEQLQHGDRERRIGSLYAERVGPVGSVDLVARA
jgi:hypothetical protein